MTDRRFSAAVSLSLAMILAATGAAFSDDGDGLKVVLTDGLLSVDASNARLDHTLRAIAGQSGVQVVIEGALSDRITRRFAREPLERGLRRLLDGHSFVLEYEASRDTSRLTRLRVYARAPRPATSNAVQPQVSTVDEPSSEEMAQWVRSRLRSDDRGTQIVAIRRLDRLPPGVALEIAEHVLRSDADAVVRGQAAMVLGGLQVDETPDVLAIAMLDPEPSVRLHAVDALARCGIERGAEILGTAILTDSDRGVRLAAVAALETMDVDIARENLLRAASADDAQVRSAVRSALDSAASRGGDDVATRRMGSGSDTAPLPYRGSKAVH